MSAEKHILHVDADAPIAKNGWKNLLRQKELLFTLAGRDYRVRFVQTRLGYVWAVIQPLILISILTFLFGRVIEVDTGGIPYPLFAISGQILWSFFSFSAVQGGQSLIQSQHIIRKIWFPRAVLPLSKSIVGLIDLGVGFILTLVLFAIYGQPIAPQWYLIPLALATTIMASMGLALWTSSLSIRFRDAQHALPYAIQFLFFLTPVAYPSGAMAKAIPAGWEWLPYLNPMAGPIDLMRMGLFGNVEWTYVQNLSLGIGLLLAFLGWRYFHRVERNMADTL